jgi:anaerobic glycerol-3-phosphate dehydrogenase
MAYVRSQSSQHHRRPVRASVVVLALGAWLALGLISQAAFQLIG